jgi:hypothetical protein
VNRDALVRIVQAVITTSLISMALAWAARSAARRRHLAAGTPDRAILAYPRWTTWLGLGCTVMFSVFAWFAWHAPPSRGGPGVALVFLAFALLGVVVFVGSLADAYVVDEAGVARLRFGRSLHVAWSELARVSMPWPSGQGVRLESRRGVKLEVAAMVDGFGVLCDALLTRAPAGLSVAPATSELVVKAATLPPERLQRAYARWFEKEEDTPPPGMLPTELAVALGRAFAARMLWRHGSFVPFEARWTASGAARITHGEPRGDDPGHAALQLDGRDIVLTTDEGTSRESLDT